MDIWAECEEQISLIGIEGTLIRIVESQEQVATNSLVNNLAEQALLEEMLERSKPILPPGTEQLHYLLATPFRYPPLPHGSRFGSRFESSLFYGAHDLATVLAEAAYYRFVFWSGMRTPPPSSKFVTQHTVFTAQYKTETGLQLQNPPFINYQQQLTDPSDYIATQQLGSAMRNHGVTGFEYHSARDPDSGINVALFAPEPLITKLPLYQHAWLCETNAHIVRFSQSTDHSIYQFDIASFLIDGQLPHLAI